MQENQIILSAEKSEIRIGNISLNGVMDEKGKFYISILEIAKFINYSIEDFCNYLGTTPFTERLNYLYIENSFKDDIETCLSIEDFIKLLNLINVEEINLNISYFLEDLECLALTQLFQDSFEPWNDKYNNKIIKCTNKTQALKLEKFIHNELKNYKIQGEWFKCNVEYSINLKYLFKKFML